MQGRHFCISYTTPECGNLETKVSQFLVIMTRGSIRHNVLFRSYLEYKDLDIEYRRNEEDCLERTNWFSLYRFFAKHPDDSGVVTRQPQATSGPFLVPQDKGMENCEDFLPVDVLFTMPCRDAFRKDMAIVDTADSFKATCVL